MRACVCVCVCVCVRARARARACVRACGVCNILLILLSDLRKLDSQHVFGHLVRTNVLTRTSY